MTTSRELGPQLTPVHPNDLELQPPCRSLLPPADCCATPLVGFDPGANPVGASLALAELSHVWAHQGCNSLSARAVSGASGCEIQELHRRPTSTQGNPAARSSLAQLFSSRAAWGQSPRPPLGADARRSATVGADAEVARNRSTHLRIVPSAVVPMEELHLCDPALDATKHPRICHRQLRHCHGRHAG